MRTMPVEDPRAQGAAPSAIAQPSTPQSTLQATRIGLLLPLQSRTLGVPAEAVRAGFMAGYERDRAGFTVNVVPTGDTPEQALAAYTAAVQQNDIIVGPLARPAVSIVAASTAVTKPTIALNHPEQRGKPLPRQMLVVGLSIEDEARQVASWAAAEHPGGRALVLAGNVAWQRRIAGAFHERWHQLGHTDQVADIPLVNGRVSEEAIAALRTQLEIDPPDLLFAALDANGLRQLRAQLGTAIVCYGTSSVNPGREPGLAAPELDGVRLLDLPWEVQGDHPAVMIYPRWIETAHTLDMDRLYALGIDAFRVAREIALRPGVPFQLDGVTGQLAVDPGRSSVERTQPKAVYGSGSFVPVASGR
jgi:outer membrane PBP1 activator LpoA protein